MIIDQDLINLITPELRAAEKLRLTDNPSRMPLREVVNISPETSLNLGRSLGAEIGTLNSERARVTKPMQLAFKKSFKNISNPKQVEDLIFKTFQKGSS